MTNNLDGGFSLIEFLAAVALIGIAILPILGAFTFSWQSSVSSFRRSKAVMLGRWKIEQLRTTETYSEIDDVSRKNCKLPSPYWSNADPAGEYECEITVHPISHDHDRYSAKQVNIKIIFATNQEKERTLNCSDMNKCSQPDFSTMIAKKDA